MTAKPHLKLTVLAGRPITVEIPRRETPIEAARRRHGKAFAIDAGSTHRHEQGPAYWTAERIAALAEANAIRRKRDV